MTRHVVGALIAGVIVCGCAARPAERKEIAASPAGQRLIHPPDVPDLRYPGGFHIRADAPLASWHQVAVFATHEECESSRTHRIDAAIDEARAKVGDKAKYQLSVRRAVNARCVSLQ